NERLQLFGGFLAVLGTKVELGQCFAQSREVWEALQQFEINANGFLGFAKKGKAVGQFFHEQRIGSVQMGGAIEDFEGLGFYLFAVGGAAVSSVEFAQINKETGIGRVPARGIVEDLKALVEVIVLKIKLREVTVAKQGIGHLVNGSAIGFDGEIFF